MNNLKTKVQEQDYDNLIILDACRYDFFEKFYNNFINIEGDLEKVKSPANCSVEFATKILNQSFDYELYNTNALIGSSKKGFEAGAPEIEDYNIEKHFKKTHSLWQTLWREETVYPEDVRKHVERNGEKKGNFIWFIQPHAPFIGPVKIGKSDTGLVSYPNVFADTQIFPEWVRNSESGQYIAKKAYKMNLLKALHEVSILLNHLEGETIITADHGECLGDNGYWGHGETHVVGEKKLLREVPWLRVDCSQTFDIKNSDNKNIVKQLYLNVLNREPDEEGWIHHKEQLDSEHGKNLLGTTLTMIESDEYKKENGEICEEVRKDL